MCLLDCSEDSESSRSGIFDTLATSVQCSLVSRRLARYHSSDCWLTARDMLVVVLSGTKAPGRRQIQQPCRADDRTPDGIARPSLTQTIHISFHSQGLAKGIVRLFSFLHAIAVKRHDPMLTPSLDDSCQPWKRVARIVMRFRWILIACALENDLLRPCNSSLTSSAPADRVESRVAKNC